MAFNTIQSTSGADKVYTQIVNQINVDAINVKVLPAGTNPNVVYRIGDGTVHPDGFENTLDYKYIDFYVSTGAQGVQGEKGEDGQSAYTQAVANGYTGTQVEFYALLTAVAQNAVDAEASAVAAAASATAASLSESNASSSETNAALSESNASTSATNAALSESNASTSESNASTSATAAAGSATSASSSASAASTSETNAQNSADLAIASYDLFDDRFLGSKASDPTLDNDGDTLQAGTLYYNATAGEMRVYSGTIWQPITAATTLDGLTDIDITGIADGKILVYNSTSGNWEIGDSTTDLVNLTDTTITSPTDGQILAYDNATGKWINTAAPSTATDQPVLSSAGTVVEGADLVVTITNFADYSQDVVWSTPVTSSGTVSRTGNTITVTAGAVDADETGHTVTITAKEPSHDTSAQGIETFTVTNTAVVADTAVVYDLSTLVINDGY